MFPYILHDDRLQKVKGRMKTRSIGEHHAAAKQQTNHFQNFQLIFLKRVCACVRVRACLGTCVGVEEGES